MSEALARGRRHFHVRPQDPAQLEIWRRYLTWEEKASDLAQATELKAEEVRTRRKQIIRRR